jgi:uncharacterized protein YjbI with pentapeptide repeats
MKTAECKQFKQIVFTDNVLNEEYENCEFINCTFAEIHIGKVGFDHCKFTDCNLSLCKMNTTSWSEVEFVDCKMTGIEFTYCNNYSLSVGFTKCNLQYALFVGTNLHDTIFDGCNLQEADFSEANLKGASFMDCDLALAVFSKTNLEKANFTTAVNFEIDPTNNRLKKTRFSGIWTGRTCIDFWCTGSGLKAHSGLTRFFLKSSTISFAES